MKAYKVSAIRQQEIELDIISETEDNAIDIMEKLLDDFDMFDKVDNYAIEYTVSDIGNISNNNINENCKNCEYYCPVCGECTVDE